MKKIEVQKLLENKNSSHTFKTQMEYIKCIFDVKIENIEKRYAFGIPVAFFVGFTPS